MRLVHGLLYALAAVLSGLFALLLVLGGVRALDELPTAVPDAPPEAVALARDFTMVMIGVGALFAVCFLGLVTVRRWAPLVSGAMLALLGLYVTWALTSEWSPDPEPKAEDRRHVTAIFSAIILFAGVCFLTTTIVLRRRSQAT
ncbi:MAG: hypothetical protein WAT39_15610 [Planctomycetota bacterium]